ncbi:glycosyltransferase [Flavobacteriaceae bacterium KMM 6897]|nr:glycosyltransferase [Flavobacteriaceae bacterium KMM 6897]
MVRKKIIQILPQLNTGGAERFVVDLCNKMVENHEIVLFTFFPLETHGFFVKELNSDIKIKSFNKKVGFDFILPFKILLELIREKPQIIHTHLNSFYYTLLSIIVMRNSKHFHTLHSDALKEAPGKWGVFFKKLIFKMGFSTPVTVSLKSQLGFMDQYKLNAIKIDNGRNIDLSQLTTNKLLLDNYKKNPETKILLNIARISHEKNQIMLANAVNELTKEGYNIVLIILGPNRDNEIINAIENIGNKYIYLVGEKENPLDYLASADAFCLTSLYEGMPITLIEAFAAGTIPICTPAGGIVDMIENDLNGLLSNDHSKEQYLTTLKKFIEMSNEDLDLMKRNCQNSFAKYSMENCANEYLDLFDK